MRFWVEQITGVGDCLVWSDFWGEKISGVHREQLVAGQAADKYNSCMFFYLTFVYYYISYIFFSFFLFFAAPMASWLDTSST
jgi:hypothetical protein